jgi:hypothetical protein
MPRLSREFTLKRQELVIQCLDDKGNLPVETIAEMLQEHPQSIRRTLKELREAGTVLPVKKVGQTVYWGLKGRSVIPSLLGTESYVPYSDVMRIALDRGVLFGFPQGKMEEVLAYLYAQPIIAAVGGEIKHRELDYMLGQVDEIIQLIDDMRTRLVDYKKRIHTDSVAEFEAWANDARYDRELALSAFIKFVPDSTVNHHNYREAFRLGAGGNMAGGIATDSDESDS